MKLLIDLQCVRQPKPQTGIERYALELSKAIVRNAGEHELWITTGPHTTDAVERIFGRYVPRSRILRLVLPPPVQESTPADTLRTRVSEWIREAFIADLAPDVVHLTSLVWDGIVASIDDLETGPRTAVTQYDLIPLFNPDQYLPVGTVRNSYERRIRFLHNADLLLSISEYSKQEVVNAFGFPADRIAVIPGAVDSQFRPASGDPGQRNVLHRKYGISKDFTLCVNICDPRKNVDRLIRAFARLPIEIRANRQLVLVGHATEEMRAKHQATASAVGLSVSELVPVGAVSDSDLRLLYSVCELFVMPSLHEGLGLPILEAMACGAPVIGSRTTSIPEIVGRADALFDPEDVDGIAAKMREVLTQANFARTLRQWSTTQSGRFSWDRSAKLAWDAFLELHHRPKHRSRPDALAYSRPRLAWLISSAISGRSPSPGYIRLLRELSRHYDLETITASAHAGLTPEFGSRNLDSFETHADGFDRIVYDASGQYFTSRLQRLMEDWPGVVILRDLEFSEWMHHGEAANDREWARRLYQEDGIAAVRSFLRTRDTAKYLGVRSICQNSTGTIVCSEEVWTTLQDYLGKPLADELEPVRELATVSWEACDQSKDTETLADRLHEIVEQLFRSHPNARLNRLLVRIGSQSDHFDEGDLRSFAECITANRLFAQPRLLVDADLFMRDPTLAGVPRVVRSVVDQLTRAPRPGLRIEPFRRDGPNFYTCSTSWRNLGVPDFGWTDCPIEPIRTDRVILFELGLAADAIATLARRQAGTYLVLFDILPIRCPNFFAEGVGRSFERSLRAAVADVDGIVCISRAVADDLNNWLFEERIPRRTPLRIGWFHLGADLPCAGDSELPEKALGMLNQAFRRPLALIVGSLEYRSDRKGYGQALDAFELLWGRGYDAGLALVGQRVSPTDELTDRITGHVEFGRRLFWFENARDSVLAMLYKSSTVLLYPSHGEGFGLPLIEAAWHDLPVIARDLPVFREIAGEDICYFEGYGASDLAAAIEAFLALKK